MKPTPNASIDRRGFLQRTGLTLGSAAAAAMLPGCQGNPPSPLSATPRRVAIVYDPSDPVATSAPAKWAMGRLCVSLNTRRLDAQVIERGNARGDDLHVLVASRQSPLAKPALSAAGVQLPDTPESLALVPHERNLLACANDSRGLVYALTELADRVDHAENPIASINIPSPILERPANSIRGVMRVFASDVEDIPWFNDREFWRPYLSMLAEQRFNRFNLALGVGYDFARQLRDTDFYFAYPFLVSPPGYNVRVTNLPAGERENNLEMLKFISDEAAARGLHFQLGIWTHAYQWTDSPHANHVIEGLTPAAHAAYCRDALQTLLQSCPNISGVTFRIHGESGVAEGSYDFWKTVFDGIVRCGRTVEIDMHAKGIDQPMIDLALATGMPVNVSPKYWAEHMGLPYHQAAIRSNELPKTNPRGDGFFSRSSGSRSFLRYGYGDLLREDRRYGIVHRIWPGTQRLLLWGDSETAAAYGRASSFCGSNGIELFEPLSFKGRKGSGLPGGRDAYADASLKPTGGDWEKYLYTYRLWGRLLYNPDADPETWRRSLRTDYGPASAAAENALANASRILPLITTAHLPSAANNNYWPEIYTNMPIVDASRPHPYSDTPSPKRFGAVSPLDPQLFSRIDDFADELLTGKSSGKYSPAEVAKWIEESADAAARGLSNGPDASLRRVALDVSIVADLGHFFADKFRAGVLYAIYQRTGEPGAHNAALNAYRRARTAWANLAGRADSPYVRDITFGWDKHLRGHWSDRVAAIDQDIADMERAPSPHSSVTSVEQVSRAIRAVLEPQHRSDVVLEHARPEAFQPGQPVIIEATVPPAGLGEVKLWYRRVNQAEAWRAEPMHPNGRAWRAVIPAGYTDSPYPLQYYFELRHKDGNAALWPAFNATRTNFPYLIIRTRRSS